jgi:type I restriction enzyme S subunit
MTLVLKPAEIYAKRLLAGRLGLLAFSDKWDTRPLGELINLLNGAPFDSAYFNTYGLGKPLIRIRDVGKTNTETWYNKDYEDKYLIKAGDVLVGLDGDFKAAEWRGPEALLNQRVCKLEPNENLLDKRFMLYHLQGWLNAIWEETSATTVKHLSSKSIQEIPFPVPPIEEQKRIVETLDGHLSKLDKAISDLDYADSQALLFRRSILNRLLSPQLSGSEQGTERMSSGDLGIALLHLGDLVTFTGGYSFKSSDWKESGVPVLKIANVRNGEVTLDGCSFVNLEVADQTTNFAVTKGDLLMTLTGEIGAMGFYQHSLESRLNQRLCKVEVKDPSKVAIEYVHYFLTSPNARKTMWAMSKGAAQANISVKDIATLKLPLPSIEEQKRIVETLDGHLSRLDSTRKSIASQKSLIANLRRSILNSTFTARSTKEN